MQEEQTPSQEYIKAYNQGYMIQKHLPDLADNISRSLPNTERSEGFKDGQEQYKFEREKSRPKFLQSDRLSKINPDPNKSKDKDKDDFEHQ